MGDPRLMYPGWGVGGQDYDRSGAGEDPKQTQHLEASGLRAAEAFDLDPVSRDNQLGMLIKVGLHGSRSFGDGGSGDAGFEPGAQLGFIKFLANKHDLA